MISLLFVFFLNTTFADNVVGCAADAVVENPAYILQCTSSPAACTCPSGVTNTAVDFHLSRPLESTRVVRCTAAPPPVVQAISTINEMNNPSSLNSAEVPNPDCPPIITAPDEPVLSPVANQPAGIVSTPSLGEFIDSQTYRFRNGCGYNLKLRATPINSFITSVMGTNGPEQTCLTSMCTTASYSVFLLTLREMQRLGKLPASVNVEELSTTRSPGWNYFNTLARPDLAIFEMGIGSGRTINPSEIASCATKNWPAGGDFVQIWRSDNSGHSVVFSNYLKNSAGENIGICYWSSNSETQGLRHRCESLNNITKIVVGRITL